MNSQAQGLNVTQSFTDEEKDYTKEAKSLFTIIEVGINLF